MVCNISFYLHQFFPLRFENDALSISISLLGLFWVSWTIVAFERGGLQRVQYNYALGTVHMRGVYFLITSDRQSFALLLSPVCLCQCVVPRYWVSKSRSKSVHRKSRCSKNTWELSQRQKSEIYLSNSQTPHRKPFHPACVTGLNRCCTKPKNGHLKRTHTAFCTAPRETSSNGPTKWNIERQTQESGSMVSGIGGRIGMYRQRMTVMIMTLMPTCSRSPLQNRPSNIIKHCSIIVRVLTVPCSPSYTRIFVKKFSSFHLGVSGLSGGKKKNQTYQAFLCLTAKDTNITELS